jgi:hypothetical protein
MNFHRDDDKTLCMLAVKYILKMVSKYEKIFGEFPKQSVRSPLEKGNQPKLDIFELSKGIEWYQSIGSRQWAVIIGRFDIHIAVMTLSGFRVAPSGGHLNQAKRLYGYLSKMHHAAIRICVDEPDYLDLPDHDYDWSKTVYGELKEIIPDDVP